MFSNVLRRGRVAALSAICAAGLLGTAGAASASASVAHPQAGVPWAQVGPGWSLAEYTNGTKTKHAPTTLYVVSPSDARYAVYTWRASAVAAPALVAWSGDKTRALLSYGGGQMAQLNLLTGKLSKFTMAGAPRIIGYTRPDGLNILGVQVKNSMASLARYSLTGKLVKVLVTNNEFTITGIDSPDGTMLAVFAGDGMELVSNAGGVIRKLPVPGTNPLSGCTPARWWNANTILATCFADGSGIPRLWLVPASGATPTPLTPQRKASPADLGDVDAWQLPSGLYLQSLGACATLLLNKQIAGGKVSPVKVPGTANTSTLVVTAAGPRLLIAARSGCMGGNVWLWFNPATRAETWLLKAPAGAIGVEALVPFYSNETGTL